MKQICKKPKIFIVALVALMMITCGGMSLLPTVKSQENDNINVTSSWYEFESKDNSITLRLSDDIRSLLKLNNKELTELKNNLTSALKNIFMDAILNSSEQGQAISNFVLLANGDPDLDVDVDSDDFWADVKGNPAKFKDYITKRLSDPAELQDFVNKKYEMLLEQVIGEYIQSERADGASDEEIEEKYGKIESAIEDVVKEATETAAKKVIEDQIRDALTDQYFEENEDQTEVDPEVLEKYIQEHIEQYKTDNKEKLEKDKEEYKKEKETAAKEAVSAAVTKVEENGGNPPAITVDQMLGAIRGIDIDNTHLYDTYGGVSNAGLKYLIGKLPRPGAIAQMDGDDLRNLFSADFNLDTTYGPVPVKVTLGFMGKTQMVQRAAKRIADHFDAVRDGENLTVNVNIPELIAKFFRAIYNAGGISLESKEAIFDIFNKSMNDAFDGSAYKYDELITILKQVNYQKLFANFITASAFNDYFGDYVTELFGRKLTDDDIKKAVSSLRDYALKVSKWDVDTVAEFLNKIPGFKSLAESIENGKYNSAINKFLDLVKKINWEKYDADQILEILADESITEKVLNYIDEIGDFSDLYNKLLSSMGKVLSFLPDEFKGAKLSELYDSETQYGYDGEITLAFGDLMKNISEIFGEGGIASFFENLETVFYNNTFDYNLDFNMTVPGIYKVEYVYDLKGDKNYTVLKTGLIPEGVDIDLFAPKTIKLEDGTEQEVKYWVDVNAETYDESNAVEKVEHRDMRVRAVIELDEEIEVSVKAYLVPTIKGYDGFADRQVRYTYVGEEREVMWKYRLTGVSRDGKVYGDEILHDLFTASATTVLKATEAGNYTSTLTLTPNESEYKDLIKFADVKGEQIFVATETWIIEKAKINVSDIKLTTEEETFFTDDENYSLYFKDEEGGEHSVKWDYKFTVENDYDGYWTEEKINNTFEFTIDGDKSNKANEVLTATLKIALKEENNNIIFSEVDATANWIIKKTIPIVTIDLSNAKWMYNNSEFTEQTEIFADGNPKALTVGGVNGINDYFTNGILKIAYTDSKGNKTYTAPSAVGTYTVSVELVETEGYKLENNIKSTTLTIKAANVIIDLGDAKWTYNGKVVTDGEVLIEDENEKVLTLSGLSAENSKLFDNKIIAVVYYQGETKLEKAPKDVGEYTVKVELLAKEGFSLKNNLELKFSIAKKSEVAKIKISLSDAKWMLGEDEYNTTDEIFEDGTTKVLTVGNVSEDIEKYFREGVLVVTYYSGDTKLDMAPYKAGSYKVKVELTDDTRYELENNIAETTITIKEKAVEPSGTVSINLSEAKWTYEGKEIGTSIEIALDSETKVLDISADETIKGYFDEGVLEIVYYKDSRRLEGEPEKAGVYIARVELKVTKGYRLVKNIADATLIIVESDVPVQDKEIDLSNAKWMFEGQEVKDNKVEVTEDGNVKTLTVGGSDEIVKYFTDNILEVTYYNGNTKVNAPSAAGVYTVKVELKAAKGYKITKNIAEATLTITASDVQDKEIDLSNAKWMFNGQEVKDNKVEVTEDGNVKTLTVGGSDEIVKYFTDNILEVTYYNGNTKVNAPSAAGVYTVKVELKAAKGYKITKNIAEATLTIKAKSSEDKTVIDLSNAKWFYDGEAYSSTTELIEDGKAKQLTIGGVVAEVEKFFEDGILAIEYYDKYGTKLSAAPSSVGEYTAKVVLVDGEKYELRNNIADAKIVIKAKVQKSNWGMIALTVAIAAVVIVGLVLVDMLVISKKRK